MFEKIMAYIFYLMSKQEEMKSEKLTGFISMIEV